MRKAKKTALAILTVAVILGAVPVYAQVANTGWAGEGGDWCDVPGPQVVVPWQIWEGSIDPSGLIFEGKWEDSSGNEGEFCGELVDDDGYKYVYQGGWYWYDSANVLQYGGWFKMAIYAPDKYCGGDWFSSYPSSTDKWMKGERIW